MQLTESGFFCASGLMLWLSASNAALAFVAADGSAYSAKPYPCIIFFLVEGTKIDSKEGRMSQ
jgi:hypothetical protein